MKKNGNSHHQTWLSVRQWARQPKASSDNKALVLPAQHGEPAESLRLRSSLQMSIHTYMKAYIKEAEKARNLGTRGYRKGGLEREVCNTLLPPQSSHSNRDGMKDCRAPEGFKLALFSKQRGGMGAWASGPQSWFFPSIFVKRGMFSTRARSTCCSRVALATCPSTGKPKPLVAYHLWPIFTHRLLLKSLAVTQLRHKLAMARQVFIINAHLRWIWATHIFGTMNFRLRNTAWPRSQSQGLSTEAPK